MRSKSIFVVLLILVGCCSCQSYEAKRKTEMAVEKAVEHFHEQLNEEQYQQIYDEADAELRSKVTETDFTAQLRSAHDQLGRSSSKAYVLIDETIWRGLGKAFGAKQELVSHGHFPGSELIVANERFAWAVENDQPKLVSYEFQKVCSKPCTVGIGVR